MKDNNGTDKKSQSAASNNEIEYNDHIKKLNKTTA